MNRPAICRPRMPENMPFSSRPGLRTWDFTS
jgi:hypothetical protein